MTRGRGSASLSLTLAVQADINKAGFDEHVLSEDAPAPLTMAEMEKAEIKKLETSVNIGTSTRQLLATGIAFPLVDAAIAAIDQLIAGEISYVKLVRGRDALCHVLPEVSRLL